MRIDDEYPIPFLLLRHKNHSMKDLVWYWFLIISYEEYKEE